MEMSAYVFECYFLAHLCSISINWYGVASISRLLKIIDLFCKRAL